MKSYNKALWIVSLTTILALPASAIPILQVEFASPTAVQADVLSADVSVANLDSELIGAYDLTLSWDPSLLSFVSIAFDAFLDGPGDSIQGFTDGAGYLNVFEVSLGSLFNQAGLDTFRLFNATFDAVGIGTATLGFAGGFPQILANDLGEEYAGTTLLGGTVSISSPPVSVPEPSSLTILLIGLPMLLAMRRRRGRTPSAR